MDGPTQYSTCWAWMGKMHFHQECNWFDRSLFQHVTGFIAAFFQKCTWLNHIQRGIGGAKGGNGRWAPLHLGQKKKKAWKSIVNEYNLRGIKYWLSSSNYHAFFTSSLHHSPSSAKPETSYKESEPKKKVMGNLVQCWYANAANALSHIGAKTGTRRLVSITFIIEFARQIWKNRYCVRS